MSTPWGRVRAVDSHTGGEPTRVVVEGGPDLGTGPLAERRDRFRTHHDDFRTAVVAEPRGHDVLVGALLVPPEDPTCAAGVIFFDNAGYLGMCGHGTMGLVTTLAHLGQIGPGAHRIETPVGVVTATVHDDGRVAVANVPAYRHREAVAVEVPGHGRVTGDVAWGGNWFLLCPAPQGIPLRREHAEALTAHAWAIRHALEAAGVTGEGGAEIDHVELVGPSEAADARVFVLCPGGAYDRSPCGTGTSAKLACLAADGRLGPGQVWRQESIVGSVFEGTYTPGEEGRVHPVITGRAFVTAELTLVSDPADPFRAGLESPVRASRVCPL
jgi:4-hydroxyproline epimerase